VELVISEQSFTDVVINTAFRLDYRVVILVTGSNAGRKELRDLAFRKGARSLSRLHLFLSFSVVSLFVYCTI